jgi:tetraacyldisaccharide 4'-kinase
MSGHLEKAWAKGGLLPILLAPLTLLYWIAWQLYRLPFTLGIKKPEQPHQPIICVGGLVAGGAGKTPVVIHIADVIQDLGHSVVITNPGYRSPKYVEPALSESGALDPTEWGDESALIRRLRPEIPIVSGKNRVVQAQLIEEHFPNAVMLMDDGFQHLELDKTVSIVLDQAESANKMMIPSGPYREPRSAGRARADELIPGRFHVETAPLALRNPDGSSAQIPAKAYALCAIGRPERFFDSLSSQGVDLVKTTELPDHDDLADGNLFDAFEPVLPVIVTAKDWVKLEGRTDFAKVNLLIAEHSVTIEPAAQFAEWLESQLKDV